MNLYEMFEPKEELTLLDALRDFLPLAIDHLELASLPKITFQKDVGSAEHPTFGRFTNESKVVFVDIENRHPNDILRTLAHELTHFAQNERGELDSTSGETGSDAENEANATAGVIMRNFNAAHPEYLKLTPITFNTQLDEKKKRKQKSRKGYYGYYWGGINYNDSNSGDAGGGDGGESVHESLGKSALVGLLAAALSMSPTAAQAESSDAADALRIYRLVHQYKNYDDAAYKAEAQQELMNILRSLQGHPNQSRILSIVKKMSNSDESAEELPPLTNEPINEKWSEEYKRSIDCSNPKGFSQRAHCAGRKKANEETCATHRSPSGQMTNMCPEDDDYEINYGKDGLAKTNENFADGKKPGRKGLAKRVGVDCGQSISKLRSIAKNSSGEKQRMAHWCANMKSGKNK